MPHAAMARITRSGKFLSYVSVRSKLMRSPGPVACTIPRSSALQPDVVGAAYYWDAYRAPLRSPPAGVVDLFFAVFGHHPRWMRRALRVRNRFVRSLGLPVAAGSDEFDATRLDHYNVGDSIGRWPIYVLNDHELVAGRDNSHLDFRVSILRIAQGERPAVIVSTVCVVHNWAGKLYLFFVLPFHRIGIKYIIAQALRSGRL